MYKKLQIVVLSLCVYSVAAWAQQNPLMGSWKTNQAKSKNPLGSPPTNNINKYEPSGANGLKYTSDRVAADGTKSHIEFTANFDAKTYPYKGTGADGAARDGVTVKKIDPYTYQVSYKKGGETVQINYWIVAKDGKTMTTVSTGVGTDNQVYSRLVVADKQ